MLSRFWKQWKLIAHKIGNFQSRILLNIFYFIILMPFGLGVKLFSDPLHLKCTNCRAVQIGSIKAQVKFPRKMQGDNSK